MDLSHRLLPQDPADWPTAKFPIILADPPWPYRDKSNHRGGATRHYPTIRLEALAELPVRRLAAADAVLFLWTTYPQLPAALELIDAWGFHYKTGAFTWVKANQDNTLFVGMGHYTRSNAELCLLATHGRALERHNKAIRNTQIHPRTTHSAKPDIFRREIEKLYGYDVPKVELFARDVAPGWHAWGNELGEPAAV